MKNYLQKWRRTFESEELLIKWRKSEELFTKVKKNVRKWRKSEELFIKVKKDIRKWRIVEKVKSGLINGRKSQKDGRTDQSKRWPQLLWCDLGWFRGTWRIFHWRYPPYGVETHDPEILRRRCVSLTSSSVEGARPHPAPPLQLTDITRYRVSRFGNSISETKICKSH